MAGILNYPITYRGLTLNNQYGTDGEFNGARENVYIVEQFDFSKLDLRDPREGLHLHTGGVLGPATKQFRHLALAGSIRAQSPEYLEDMASALASVFDVESGQNDVPSQQGVHELDFYCPTSHYSQSNPVHEVFFARPTMLPRLFERRSVGNTMAWAVELVCPDPRRYLYDQTTVTFSDAAGWTQKLPNWGDTGPHVDQPPGAMTFAQLTIDLDTQGSPSFTISPSHSGATFTMDLSTTPVPQQIVVDMETMEIYRAADGERRASLRTSDVDSWLRILPGGVEWAVTNRAGITDITAVYRQARS